MMHAGRYETPRGLAVAAGAPLPVCKLIFAVAENDPDNIALIRSPRIDPDTIRQRRAVIWVAKLHTSLSLPDIGRALNRDHSSVLRSLNEAKELWLGDPTFRHDCEKLAKVLCKSVQLLSPIAMPNLLATQEQAAMTFKKGESGNPSGRSPVVMPDGRSLTEVAREHTTKAVDCLVAMVEDEKAPHAAKVSAATALLDRGWGRPRQDLGVDIKSNEGIAALLEAARKRARGE